MKNKLLRLSLIVVTSTLLSSCSDVSRNAQALFNATLPGWNAITGVSNVVFNVASHVESITEKLYSNSSDVFEQYSEPQKTNTQSCELRDTAVITIYSTNGMAQHAIDVKLDGVPVGSLTTYYPDDAPACKTPSARGVITLMVPKGKHTVEASSPNLNWPGRSFTVDKCSCMLLPLS